MIYNILLLLLLTCACKSTHDVMPEPTAIPVYAQKPAVQDVPLYVEALGSLQPISCVNVHPLISGVLTHVSVKEGDEVVAGDTLFVIEQEPFAIKVEQARASITSSTARLKAAQKKHRRFKALADKELISKNEWDEIETAMLLAKAELQLDKAKLREAELDRSYCTVKAQNGGRVGKLDIHPGHFVTKDAPLVELVLMDPLVVEFTVTEAEFSKISKEQKTISIGLLSNPERVYNGEITFIDNHFDRQSGLIAMRGKVTNAESALRSGMSVKVKIPVGTLANSLVVPQKAVKYNQFGAFVYVVQDDNTLALKQVEVVQDLGEHLVLASGINAEERVLTEGHQRAHIGAKVEVKE